MSDEQICGMVLLWFLAGWLGRSARSCFRMVLLAVALVAMLTSCAPNGYCYREARLVGRSAAHAQAQHRRKRRHIWRVVRRRQVRDYEADRRLREHSQIRPGQ